jgi:thioester reductase-like protein
MSYFLLTGATGLLGSYLLRDNLRAGRRMAVLARPDRGHSARDRIESALTDAEQATATVLPRPVVIEGDLTEDKLGLDAAAVGWISRHCTAVIHSAASLTFRSSDRAQEPWLTNVVGTRRLLDLCRSAGIRQWHHVSTAYVCGLRNGPVFEEELDVGQQFGNDYEQSKAEAEALVRRADFLEPATIYRPSILVGDFATGWTATYHGFYAALRLAHTLSSRMVRGSRPGNLVVEGLGLAGHERKNFVPVDWVSRVMVSLLGRAERHGRTYHLVSRHPVAISRVSRIIEDAVEAYSPLASEWDAHRGDGHWFLRQFRSEMEVYRSYWRDDPEFDDRQTMAATGLACPELDDAALLRLSRWAICQNFGKSRRSRPRLDFDVYAYFHGETGPAEPLPPVAPAEACLGLQVDGPGGGQWKLLLREGRRSSVEPGLSAECSPVLALDSQTFRALACGECSVAEAAQQGRLAIHGGHRPPGDWQAMFAGAIAPASVRLPVRGDERLRRCA